MKRLVAVAAVALALAPLTSASASPARNRLVDCTVQYVVREPNVRDYLWCLSLR